MQESLYLKFWVNLSGISNVAEFLSVEVENEYLNSGFY